jgi:hypothetical protein
MSHMDRFALIARKQEVRRQLERVNRQLEAENNATPPIPNGIGGGLLSSNNSCRR